MLDFLVSSISSPVIWNNMPYGMNELHNRLFQSLFLLIWHININTQNKKLISSLNRKKVLSLWNLSNTDVKNKLFFYIYLFTRERKRQFLFKLIHFKIVFKKQINYVVLPKRLPWQPFWMGLELKQADDKKTNQRQIIQEVSQRKFCSANERVLLQLRHFYFP